MKRLPKTKIKSIGTWHKLIVLSLLLSSYHSNSQIETRGIYGHPQPLWDKGYNLPELGVNALFLHSNSIDSALMGRAKKQGIAVYSEFATLNGKNYVDKHPEAWAINEKGEPVEAATWFMGVCPTEPGFRAYRLKQLRQLLQKYDVKGIWMDYVHWHAQFEDPEPILPETCFCDHCLSSFSEYSNIKLQEGDTKVKAQWILNNKDKEWRDWRCQVIYNWAVAFRKIIKEEKPGTLLGLYHCPWDDEEYVSARRRILGLDYDLLHDVFDVFSPMVYHARMGRDPAWVEENIRWFCKRIQKEEKSPKVWPIIQAYNNPYIISSKEFETVLKGGMSGQANGIMMFTTKAIADDEQKMEVLKRIYNNMNK